ncbi:MAG TPA: DUF3455 domain-containing protein [Edaphobacter sp.]|jgi:hypothetical protein|nr:DUF3455 domain-containing protein [Edaphobacter sp.]
MLPALLLFALSFAPQTTDPTLPPSSAHVVYTVEGRGVQIYRCTEQDSAFTWIFQSPEASLFDPSTHRQTGTHTAGPTWTWKDGSAITGKVLQKFPSHDPLSIPWLLLSTTPSGATNGALSTVTLVRRSDTHGGNAPATGCDAQHKGSSSRVPYTATYTFYTNP